jgi:hypothetical protein
MLPTLSKAAWIAIATGLILLVGILAYATLFPRSRREAFQDAGAATTATATEGKQLQQLPVDLLKNSAADTCKMLKNLYVAIQTQLADAKVKEFPDQVQLLSVTKASLEQQIQQNGC